MNVIQIFDLSVKYVTQSEHRLFVYLNLGLRYYESRHVPTLNSSASGLVVKHLYLLQFFDFFNGFWNTGGSRVTRPPFEPF